jgi:hypothetical protein
MICPVGTSLRNNANNQPPWKSLRDPLGKLGKSWEQDPDPETTKTDLTKAIEASIDHWLPSVGTFDKITRYPTAELQAITRWLHQIAPSSGSDYVCLHLYLLPSEDPSSWATARMTDLLLPKAQGRILGPNVKIGPVDIQPMPIRVKNEKEFNRSISDLFKKYDEIGDNLEGSELVINATGGYKAICIFSSLYAQIKRLKFLYTFEELSNETLELPPLPIDYALESLDDEISLLKALKERQGLPNNIDISKLPPWLKNLFDFSEGGGLLPLAEILLNHYREHRFSAEAIGSGMLDQLDDNGRRYLEGLIRGSWSQLWLGDQIPETVEHSRRHSKRLMELAGNLYRSAPEQLEAAGMRKPQAVALLIAAIYLHDIGHTAMAHPVSEKARKTLGGVFPLGNFPSCVREVHHLLSAELVRNRADELFPVSEEKEKEFALRDMLIDLVPFLAEHHRGYTTLTSNKAESVPKTIRSVGTLLYGEDFFAETLLPLESRLEKRGKKWDLSTTEITTTAALLRILDGCDVQSDRTFNPAYMKARLSRTKAEGEAIWWELRPLLRSRWWEFRPLLRSKWENFTDPTDRIHEISEQLDPEAGVEGTLDHDLGMELSKLCKSVYAAVMDALLSIRASSGGYLLTSGNHRDLMTLSRINRYAFKWEQFLHFYKHRCVGFILPMREGNGIKIRVFPNSEFNTGNDSLDGVVHDIEAEIAGTGDMLNTLGITVEKA